MTQRQGRWAKIHRWIRRAFVTWAIVSTAWLANSVRTQGVDPEILRSSESVSVSSASTVLSFHPQLRAKQSALIFVCGSGIAAEAYAPLVRPLADEGYPVFVVRLPWRFAPREGDKEEAIQRVERLIADHPEMTHWVLAGHSLGAALCCRIMQSPDPKLAGVVLIGTTHPKVDDLSGSLLLVTKVIGSSDGIARLKDVYAHRRLLPLHTKWVEIPGGNHSQFGHYGHQLFDGAATITRDDQQRMTRHELRTMLQAAAN